jgi:hypothetical protein
MQHDEMPFAGGILLQLDPAGRLLTGIQIIMYTGEQLIQRRIGLKKTYLLRTPSCYVMQHNKVPFAGGILLQLDPAGRLLTGIQIIMYTGEQLIQRRIGLKKTYLLRTPSCYVMQHNKVPFAGGILLQLDPAGRLLTGIQIIMYTGEQLIQRRIGLKKTYLLRTPSCYVMQHNKVPFAGGILLQLDPAGRLLTGIQIIMYTGEQLIQRRIGLKKTYLLRTPSCYVMQHNKVPFAGGILLQLDPAGRLLAGIQIIMSTGEQLIQRRIGLKKTYLLRTPSCYVMQHNKVPFAGGILLQLDPAGRLLTGIQIIMYTGEQLIQRRIGLKKTYLLRTPSCYVMQHNKVPFAGGILLQLDPAGRLLAGIQIIMSTGEQLIQRRIGLKKTYLLRTPSCYVMQHNKVPFAGGILLQLDPAGRLLASIQIIMVPQSFFRYRTN